MSEVRKKITKISIVEIAALILIAWLCFTWGFITRSLSLTKYWVVTGTFIPYIWILLLVGYLGKKGIKIGKEFLLSVMFILMLFTAKWYYFSGSSEVNFYNNIAGSFSSAMMMWQWPAEAKSVLAGLLPTWLVPQNEAAAAIYYGGGGDPNWAIYSAPIMAWSLIFISIALISAPMMFLIFGPHWWEVERMQWPLAIPSMYTINETYPTEEGGEWGKLLGFTGRNKIFWIAFAAGLFLNAPYIATQLFPAIPAGGVIGGGYGTYPIELYSLVEAVLPNAQINTSLVLYNALILAIFPLDISASILIFRIFTGFIYRPLVTRMGIVPPGVDPATAWPWPHATFVSLGGFIGLGALSVWVTRKRWIKAFSSFKEDFEVEGMSMRLGMTLMIIGVIIFLGIWIVAGGDPGIMILWFMLFTLVNIGGGYYYAGTMWYGADCMGPSTWQLTFPAGVATGVFSLAPPQPSPVAAAVHGFASSSMGTCVGPYEGNGVFSQTLMTINYGLAKGTRADIKKFFTYIITTFIFLVPFAFVVNTYVNSHVGIGNTGETGMDANWWGVGAATMDTGVRSVTWNIGQLSFSDMWLWTIVGSAFFIIIGWLRTVFPWFFLHPLGVLIGIRNAGWVGWVNPIIGISLRVILERTLGPKRAMEYLIPILSGLVIGLGSLYFIVGLSVMLTTSLPNLAALWR